MCIRDRYDLVWNGTAVILMLIGFVVLRRGARAYRTR